VYHRLKALSPFADIVLASPAPARSEDAEIARKQLQSFCRSVYFGPAVPPLNRGQRLWQHVKGSLGGLSTAALEAVRGGLREVFSTAASDGPFDLILMEHVYTPRLLQNELKSYPSVPVVMAEQNVEHIVAEDMGRDTHCSGFRRWLWKQQAKQLCRLETQLYPAVSTVIHISTADAELMRRRHPKARISVAPPRLESPANMKTDYGASGIICFFGTLGYFPNAEGLSWFAREVWPFIHRQRPDACLRIIGEPPAAIKQQLATLPRTEITGSLPHAEADRLIIESDVVISPIRYGSGIKIKNLVAMGMAMPLAATSASLSGLVMTHGVDAVQEDDPVKLADAIIELLGDQNRRRNLGQSARKRFEQEYTGDKSSVLLEQILRQAITDN